MEMTIEHAQGRVPVTVLKLAGDLDGSNYRQVIEQAQKLQRSGTRYLVLDLGATPYMSSAGLVALHSIALLYSGSQPPDPEQGWRAIRAVAEAAELGRQPFVKLLNVQPRVSQVLDQTGLLSFFEVHTDSQAAVSSF